MAKKAKSLGVYLSREDVERLDAVCEELGVTNHALMQWAMMDFLNRYEAGEAKPHVASQPVLIPPEAAEKSES